MDASPTPGMPKTYTLDDIKDYLVKKYSPTEIEILGTTTVGTDYQLIEYFIKISTNRFAICNIQTGTIEELPIQDVILKKAVSENYFIFEDRGEFTDSAFRFFPKIVRCFRFNEGTQDSNFTATYEDALFDLSRSVEAGSYGKDGSVLSVLNVTFDGFEMLFRPNQEDGMMFYADATSIPTTSTSYDVTTNQFTVEVATVALGAGIKSNVTINTADNLYMSSYKILREDGKTYVVANLNDFAKRYMIKQKIGPDAYIEGIDGSFPYLIVTFAPKPDYPVDY